MYMCTLCLLLPFALAELLNLCLKMICFTIFLSPFLQMFPPRLKCGWSGWINRSVDFNRARLKCSWKNFSRISTASTAFQPSQEISDVGTCVYPSNWNKYLDSQSLPYLCNANESLVMTNKMSSTSFFHCTHSHVVSYCRTYVSLFQPSGFGIVSAFLSQNNKLYFFLHAPTSMIF